MVHMITSGVFVICILLVSLEFGLCTVNLVGQTTSSAFPTGAVYKAGSPFQVTVKWFSVSGGTAVGTATLFVNSTGNAVPSQSTVHPTYSGANCGAVGFSDFSMFLDCALSVPASGIGTQTFNVTIGVGNLCNITLSSKLVSVLFTGASTSNGKVTLISGCTGTPTPTPTATPTSSQTITRKPLLSPSNQIEIVVSSFGQFTIAISNKSPTVQSMQTTLIFIAEAVGSPMPASASVTFTSPLCVKNSTSVAAACTIGVIEPLGFSAFTFFVATNSRTVCNIQGSVLLMDAYRVERGLPPLVSIKSVTLKGCTSTPTPTTTVTHTSTHTQTFSPTVSTTYTASRTDTFTQSLTGTVTRPVTDSPSHTPLHSVTPSSSGTQTSSPTESTALSPSDSPTRTPKHTASGSATQSSLRTLTMPLTSTATATLTPSQSTSPSPTRTRMGTDTGSSTPSNSPTPTAKITRHDTPSLSFSPSPSDTDAQTATAQLTLTTSSSSTPTSSRTASESSTTTRTSSPSLTISRSPSRSLTPSAADTVSPSDTLCPSATATPGATKTRSPTATSTPSATTSSTQTEENTFTSLVSITQEEETTTSFTQSGSSSSTPSPTPTRTRLLTDSPTGTETATSTSSPESTGSPSRTQTRTLTVSSTRTPSLSQNSTASWGTTYTSFLTRTATQTATPSATDSFTSTLSPTSSPTVTATLKQSETLTSTVSPTSEETQSGTLGRTDSPTATLTPWVTRTGNLTLTASPSTSATPKESSSGTPTHSPSSSATGTDLRTTTPTATATLNGTVTPVVSTTATSTATGTLAATLSLIYTVTPNIKATETSHSTHTLPLTRSTTVTATVTSIYSRTVSSTASPSSTNTRLSATFTSTPTAIPTHTTTPTPSMTRTRESFTFTITPSISRSPSASKSWSHTPSASQKNPVKWDRVICGNGVVEEFEVCDSSNFTGLSCGTIGGSLYSGTLKCSVDCQWDASFCSTALPPNGTYLPLELRFPKLSYSEYRNSPPWIKGFCVQFITDDLTRALRINKSDVIYVALEEGSVIVRVLVRIPVGEDPFAFLRIVDSTLIRNDSKSELTWGKTYEWWSTMISHEPGLGAFVVDTSSSVIMQPLGSGTDTTALWPSSRALIVEGGSATAAQKKSVSPNKDLLIVVCCGFVGVVFAAGVSYLILVRKQRKIQAMLDRPPSVGRDELYLASQRLPSPGQVTCDPPLANSMAEVEVLPLGTANECYPDSPILPIDRGDEWHSEERGSPVDIRVLSPERRTDTAGVSSLPSLSPCGPGSRKGPVTKNEPPLIDNLAAVRSKDSNGHVARYSRLSDESFWESKQKQIMESVGYEGSSPLRMSPHIPIPEDLPRASPIEEEVPPQEIADLIDALFQAEAHGGGTYLSPKSHSRKRRNVGGRSVIEVHLPHKIREEVFLPRETTVSSNNESFTMN